MNRSDLIEYKLKPALNECGLHLRRLNYAADLLEGLFPLDKDAWLALNDGNITAILPNQGQARSRKNFAAVMPDQERIPPPSCQISAAASGIQRLSLMPDLPIHWIPAFAGMTHR